MGEGAQGPKGRTWSRWDGRGWPARREVKLYRLGKIFRQEATPTIVKLFPSFVPGKVCLIEVVSLSQKIASVHSSRLAAKADTLVDSFAHKRVRVSTLEGCVRRTGSAFSSHGAARRPWRKGWSERADPIFPGGLRKPSDEKPGLGAGF